MVSPTGSGSGAGGTGSLGAPASPTQREIEALAWTEINKAALGIVQDSIDLSFSQIDNRYSKSHLGTHTGYRAREDQPILDHTLDNVRVMQSLNVPIEASWGPAYEHLVSQLPSGVLARFLLEQQKPFEERDPYFTAAANVLMKTAQIETAITEHCQAPNPDSLEAAHIQKNLVVSLGAVKQSIVNINEASDMASTFLIEQGANLPHFDAHQNAITQLRELAEILGKVNLSTLNDFKSENGS